VEIGLETGAPEQGSCLENVQEFWTGGRVTGNQRWFFVSCISKTREIPAWGEDMKRTEVGRLTRFLRKGNIGGWVVVLGVGGVGGGGWVGWFLGRPFTQRRGKHTKGTKKGVGPNFVAVLRKTT